MLWNTPYVISGSQFIESLEKNVLPGPLHQDSFPGTTNTQPNEIFYRSHTPELKREEVSPCLCYRSFHAGLAHHWYLMNKHQSFSETEL